jgi:eukaryotic-like serine/threonine-protein kinase
VLLEALNGRREYRGTPMERAAANALRPPAIPARLGPGWLKLLRAMTARTPSARPTPAQVRTLLDLCEDMLPATTAFDVTMELELERVKENQVAAAGLPDSIPTWATVAAVASSAAASCAPKRIESLRPRRTLAVLAAASVAAFAIVGVSTGWLTPGTSAAADPSGGTPNLTSPTSTAPPTGAPEPRPAAPATATSTVLVDLAGTINPVSAGSKPTSRKPSAPSAPSAAAACQADGGKKKHDRPVPKCRTTHGPVRSR